MTRGNPWVQSATSTGEERSPESDWLVDRAPLGAENGSTPGVEPDAVLAEPQITGPERPQPHVEAPAEGLPVRRTSKRDALWVVGAHGGAGESSVAALDPGWRASEHTWPVLDDLTPCQCVVVARTNVRGLLAAQSALTQWASSSIGPSARLFGLVLVADAPGKRPAALRDLAKVVAGGAPRVWEIPWIEAWRLGNPPPNTPPRPVSKVMSELRSLTVSPPVDVAPIQEENR